MKKILSGAILFIGLSTMAFAQQVAPKKADYSPEKRAEKITAIMADKLSLSDEQKTKVYAINLENVKKRDAERSMRITQERNNRRASMQKQDEEIIKVLNAEQKTAYENFKKERFTRKPHSKKSGANWKTKKDKQQG